MVKLTFSGGRNTLSTTTSINPEECVDGENFEIDPGITAFKMRPAYALVGTAPNAGEIRGFAQLEKQDGSLSTLIQAGTTVFEWDGATTFTSRGTVNANSRLRGPLSSNFTLDEIVIITDIELADVVKQWDGATFADLTTSGVTNFTAKYCFVSNERALYGNVIENNVDLPHLLVGSKVELPGTLSVSGVPAGADDPFFIPMPDLKPMNGLLPAFGLTIMSTKIGSIWKLSGSSALNFFIEGLYKGSAASGDEALVNIGNDVAIARAGAIDLLSGVQAFGDVVTDDITNPIQPDVQGVTDWKVVYDQEQQRVYCFPNGQSLVHVLKKSLIPRFQQTGISPWEKWTTTHGLAFQPSTVFAIKSPITGEIVTYMGDSSGNIFQMDQGQTTDPDNNVIKAFRTSIAMLVDDIKLPEGWVDYIKNSGAYSITLTFQWQGEGTWDDVSDIVVPALPIGAVYSGGSFYSGGAHYGKQFRSRFSRQEWAASGLGDGFQIKLEIQSETGFEIGSTEVLAKSASINT